MRATEQGDVTLQLRVAAACPTFRPCCGPRAVTNEGLPNVRPPTQEAAKATKVPLAMVTLANGSGKDAAPPATAAPAAASQAANGAAKDEMAELKALLAGAKEAQQQYGTFTQEQVGAAARAAAPFSWLCAALHALFRPELGLAPGAGCFPSSLLPAASFPTGRGLPLLSGSLGRHALTNAYDALTHWPLGRSTRSSRQLPWPQTPPASRWPKWRWRRRAWCVASERCR